MTFLLALLFVHLFFHLSLSLDHVMQVCKNVVLDCEHCKEHCIVLHATSAGLSLQLVDIVYG